MQFPHDMTCVSVSQAIILQTMCSPAMSCIPGLEVVVLLKSRTFVYRAFVPSDTYDVRRAADGMCEVRRGFCMVGARCMGGCIVKGKIDIAWTGHVQ